MCGIAGFVDFNKKITQQDLVNAANTLQHRGPDDSGIAVFDSVFAGIGLGHRRLSILDLSPLGHQPMYSDDKQVIIILNGEVYNFKEIRKELEQKGHRFQSNSDTEVIIEAYRQFGIDCLQRFIGMFSFVLYDTTVQKIFLVRDRAGVKPLYYYFADGCLLFASELKAFHQFPNFKKEIDHTALSLYFKYGYIRAPYSIFNNTHKLLPGHYAELNLQNQQLQLHKYWDVLDYYEKPTININEHEAIEHLDELCTSAFQYRMISDVPVGVFLSGGYDSSLVAAILQKNSTNKIKTFTIGFKDDKYNEANHAKQVAGHLGTDHHEYYCTTKEAQDIIPALPFFYDEPLGDSSAIPTILVSRLARQQVTVALSADGGDEIFAGYNRYDQLVQIKKITGRLPSFVRIGTASLLKSLPGISQKHQKIADILASDGLVITNDILSRHFIKKELQQLLKERPINDTLLIDAGAVPQSIDFINTILGIDYKTYMVDDILTKVDRATMSVGLEGREPFLDQRIIEWAAQLPPRLKYNKGGKKYLLKQLAHQYLPEKIMNRPKMGFGIPFGNWLKGDLKELVLQTITEENLLIQGLFNQQYVLKLRDDFLSGKKNNDWQLWLIFIFQLWWKEWMG
jgi:asparagine synthase (glutamine-hydrolysing)